MIGQIIPYITANPPDNCLVCDGAVYDRVDYPDLYAVLDSAFIVDADTFAVPDLRDKTIIGASATHALGDTGGEATHELSTAEIPAHSHTDTGHQHATGNSITLAAVMPGEGPVLTPNPIPAWTGSASANLSNTGGSEAHNNMQPYVALGYAVVAL
jgi:microcystin-dependent protein